VTGDDLRRYLSGPQPQRPSDAEAIEAFSRRARLPNEIDAAYAPKNPYLAFTVLGRARGLARPKATRAGAKAIRMYDPKSNVDAKAEIRKAFREAARGTTTPLDVPVTLTVIASYHTPRKQLWGTGKLTAPDADNICKLVADALNGLAYRDDANVAEVHTYKRWAAESSFTVSLTWGVEEKSPSAP
jgi:Holliday junction resolvase RusA-like endonuclease